ncbi:MAG: hypothetical protein BAJALOKI2v1_30009 [Promethearchaeota archaeon]|nr:MAG: hypothetical protein BAJALOKI2v1_30009 [Candidatus Lokiarchaeota archaeon]
MILVYYQMLKISNCLILILVMILDKNIIDILRRLRIAFKYLI